MDGGSSYRLSLLLTINNILRNVAVHVGFVM